MSPAVRQIIEIAIGVTAGGGTFVAYVVLSAVQLRRRRLWCWIAVIVGGAVGSAPEILFGDVAPGILLALPAFGALVVGVDELKSRQVEWEYQLLMRRRAEMQDPIYRAKSFDERPEG